MDKQWVGVLLCFPKGWIYILLCADGSYYTGSTRNLHLRLLQHENGEGGDYTQKRLPVKLVYFEAFERIDHAFYREKQVQGWSRKKKEALIKGMPELLPLLARNYSDYPFAPVLRQSLSRPCGAQQPTDNLTGGESLGE